MDTIPQRDNLKFNNIYNGHKIKYFLLMYKNV